MPILNFPRNVGEAACGWRSSELQHLLTACAVHVSSGVATSWAFGETERGDPQLYLLGRAPEHNCILVISRLDDVYVLEDGNGRIIVEQDNIVSLAEQVLVALRTAKHAILAMMAVSWVAIREFYEEKIEPAMAESIEVMNHCAPQLAAIA